MRISLPIFDGDAACAETDPDAFYPEKGGSTGATKQICAGCEIRLQCLQWSMDNNEQHGTWAGVSETQRKRLLRERGRRAA